MRTERRRRRTGCLSILLVLLVIVGAVLAVVDRVAAGVAEKRIAAVVRAEAERRGATPSDASATIEGFPFLTQVARGRFDDTHIVLTDVRSNTTTVQKVDVVLTDLHVPHDVMTGAKAHDIVADGVRGSATMALAEVGKGLGAPGLRLSGAGDVVHFTAPVALPGFALVATGTARVRLKGDRVWLEITEAKANGIPIPRQALDAVTNQLSRGAKLPPLPLGLHVTSISLAGSIVTVKAAADKVQLA